MGTVKAGGGGNVAEVDKNNRLQVKGVTDSSNINAALVGDGYFTTTNKVTLTSDSDSALLYVKNTSSRSLVITSTRHYLGVSDGTGDYNPTFHVNATGGTMLTGTDGVDYNTSAAINTNLGAEAQKPFEGVVRVGLEGTTQTSAAGPLFQILPSNPRLYEFVTVLPKGASLSFGVTPPTGNTSCEVVIDVLMYFVEGV